MRISDWSSDVCSSDLAPVRERRAFWLGTALIVLSACCFGLITTLSRIAYDSGGTPNTQVFLRFVAFVILIGPQTNITVGARYTNEKKTSDPNNYFIDIGYGLGPLSIGNPNPNPATIIDTPKIGRAHV